MQLQRASDYYRKYYANVTGEPTLSSWLDDQYYTLGIFPDPFDSAIIYLILSADQTTKRTGYNYACIK